MDMLDALHDLNVRRFVIARLKEKLCFYPNFRNYYFAWLPFLVQIKRKQAKTEFIRLLVKLLLVNFIAPSSTAKLVFSYSLSESSDP